MGTHSRNGEPNSKTKHASMISNDDRPDEIGDNSLEDGREIFEVSSSPQGDETSSRIEDSAASKDLKQNNTSEPKLANTSLTTEPAVGVERMEDSLSVTVLRAFDGEELPLVNDGNLSKELNLNTKPPSKPSANSENDNLEKKFVKVFLQRAINQDGENERELQRRVTQNTKGKDPVSTSIVKSQSKTGDINLATANNSLEKKSKSEVGDKKKEAVSKADKKASEQTSVVKSKFKIERIKVANKSQENKSKNVVSNKKKRANNEDKGKLPKKKTVRFGEGTDTKVTKETATKASNKASNKRKASSDSVKTPATKKR